MENEKLWVAYTNQLCSFVVVLFFSLKCSQLPQVLSCSWQMFDVSVFKVMSFHWLVSLVFLLGWVEAEAPFYLFAANFELKPDTVFDDLFF
jgi:hypothetical protein